MITSPEVATDSDTLVQIKMCRVVGEQLFRDLAPRLNRLQPGRTRTQNEFEAVCLALGALAVQLAEDAMESRRG
jgi:hypothetical protein